MAIVYIGIGSNLGNREENVQNAIALLKQNNISVLKCSAIIETDPVGGPPHQEKFLNGVLKVETSIPPQELLHKLKRIEQQLGRVRTIPHGPRSIDLDILLYDRLDLKLPHLTIPHPRMLERSFVMNPLKEIEPQLAKELSYARH